MDRSRAQWQLWEVMNTQEFKKKYSSKNVPAEVPRFDMAHFMHKAPEAQEDEEPGTVLGTGRETMNKTCRFLPSLRWNPFFLRKQKIPVSVLNSLKIGECLDSLVLKIGEHCYKHTVEGGRQPSMLCFKYKHSGMNALNFP